MLTLILVEVDEEQNIDIVDNVVVDLNAQAATLAQVAEMIRVLGGVDIIDGKLQSPEEKKTSED